MLHLGRLRVLCEVVKRGSFSAAAESLSYTQSAVSQSIARLEAETGAMLIVRDRRGVRPTDAGATNSPMTTNGHTAAAAADGTTAAAAATAATASLTVRIVSGNERQRQDAQ